MQSVPPAALHRSLPTRRKMNFVLVLEVDAVLVELAAIVHHEELIVRLNKKSSINDVPVFLNFGYM